MTKDDMIRMAREAGWEYADGDRGFEPLWAFANSVAAAEREACAQLCDEAAKDWDLNAWDDDADEKYGHKASACEECAETIRARSQT
jgi:hypothetical protein